MFYFHSQADKGLFCIIVFFVRFEKLYLNVSLLFVSGGFLFHVGICIDQRLTNTSQLLIIHFVEIVHSRGEYTIVESYDIGFTSAVGF